MPGKRVKVDLWNHLPGEVEGSVKTNAPYQHLAVVAAAKPRGNHFPGACKFIV